MSLKEDLPQIIEAILFSAGKPLSDQQLLEMFQEEERPGLNELRQAIYDLKDRYQNSAIELVHVASGYQFQSKVQYAPYISKLWEEKPARYSRALLETLALIAYRQPITRGEIEDIRGVAVSTSIFKTLLEDRGWIRVVGHREVPGRPGLYATTKQFLDYFALKSLDELPSLPEIISMGEEQDAKAELIQQELNLELAAVNDENVDENLEEVETEVEEANNSEMAKEEEFLPELEAEVELTSE